MAKKTLLLALVIAAYSALLIPQTQTEPQPKPLPQTAIRGDVEILSDTMGVDFGPYLQRTFSAIRQHWFTLVPEDAKSPLRKSGTVVIQFSILKDGHVAGMRLITSSVDEKMDRAAYGAITASDPFEPLPQEFRGSYLELRIKFLYNPKVAEEGITVPPSSPKAPSFSVAPGLHLENLHPKPKPEQPNDQKTSEVSSVEVLEKGNLNDYELKQFVEQRLMPTIQWHWRELVPDKARHLKKTQTAVVSFSVQKEGAFSLVKLDESTEDPDLDKAALEGVQSSAPVALPEKFSGDHLKLRVKFVYQKSKKNYF